MFVNAVIEHDVSRTAKARRFDPLAEEIKIKLERIMQCAPKGALPVVPFALLAKLKNRKP